jgi:hypothetical protein
VTRRRRLRAALGGLVGLVSFVAPVRAEGPIQDNSFLVEEAYNQEAGVVQHISTLQLDTASDAWLYSFTQEWPLGSQAHQLSATVVWLDPGEGADAGLGDVALHYRYQLVGSGQTRVAFSPRGTLLFPAGDDGAGRGVGVIGVQGNLPLSLVLAPALVAHSNLGATYAPGAPSGPAGRLTYWSVSAGQSLVWLAHPRLNGLVEVVATRTSAADAMGGAAIIDSLVVSPGVRAAIDLPIGLQIVPGIAVPVGVHEDHADVSIFFYLSFEHPFAPETAP